MLTSEISSRLLAEENSEADSWLPLARLRAGRKKLFRVLENGKFISPGSLANGNWYAAKVPT